MTRLFVPQSAPRLFHEPLGVDYARAVVEGLLHRLNGHSPETIARITILTNSARMGRQIEDALRAKGPGFLPKIGLVSDPAALLPAHAHPDAISPLQLRLTISHLVAGLLEAAPDLAPRSAAFDLAGSLCDLLAEMQEENVPADALDKIETGALSEHWDRSLTFLRLVTAFLDGDSAASLTPEARQSLALRALDAAWAEAPPKHPILVVGSTGSRGPTHRLMQRVAQLPQGAVILPGLDTSCPAQIWDTLLSTRQEDHPQFRHATFCAALDTQPMAVPQWSNTAPAAPERTALVSLALRPAPVTDQWRAEGPALTDTLAAATGGITLLEAQTPREEATTIALRMRAAVDAGTRVALISPDRILTRQVTAALHRWNIEPDDTAGLPLGLSAPGRLLRQTALVLGRAMTPEILLAVLKHPLTHTGAAARGQHLLNTRDLELELLREGCPFPDRSAITAWHAGRARPELDAWVAWLCDVLDAMTAPVPPRSLAEHLTRHIALVERICAGPQDTGSGTLWDKKPGEEAAQAVASLRRDAEGSALPDIPVSDYATILSSVLQSGEVRDPVRPHKGVMIWGAMEARVQSADLIILAGLNDGVWPDLPTPDPWMNRAMRAKAGLRVPDRRIGLSAHDFQQAIAGPEVWLSRAVRDAEAETVPSRWLNRLTNLLAGLPPEGPTALEQMRARAEIWRLQANAMDVPDVRMSREPRPAPAPPVAARPRKLSVTRIQTLIRDPYAIYAGEILRLRPLQPLRQSPDAPLRGTVLHAAMDAFTTATRDGLPADAAQVFERTLSETLETHAPWPAARRLWRAKLLSIAPWFLEREAIRRAEGDPLATEERGYLDLPEAEFTLSAMADRIDALPDGRVVLYDYKTGTIPTANVQKHFDRQMPLMALIVEGGGFATLGPKPVAAMIYIGLGSKPDEIAVDKADDLLAQTRAGLIRLIQSYDAPAQGYVSNRAMEKMTYEGDFNHLARKGEWDETAEITHRKVGQ